MPNGTCIEDGCAGKAAARKLCQRHYGSLYRKGMLAPLPVRENVHSLSDVDTGAETATCTICGPTKIRVRAGRRGHECWTVRIRHIGRRDKSNARSWNLKNKYGITAAEFEAMADQQGGRCAICGSKPDQLVVDHDHATGAVRELLCRNCNIALGFLKDNALTASSAADYLLTHAS